MYETDAPWDETLEKSFKYTLTKRGSRHIQKRNYVPRQLPEKYAPCRIFAHQR